MISTSSETASPRASKILAIWPAAWYLTLFASVSISLWHRTIGLPMFFAMMTLPMKYCLPRSLTRRIDNCFGSSRSRDTSATDSARNFFLSSFQRPGNSSAFFVIQPFRTAHTNEAIIRASGHTWLLKFFAGGEFDV